MNSFTMIGNNGTFPEESSFFTSIGYSFPAICILTLTKRPEGINKSDFIISVTDEKSLLQVVDTVVFLSRDDASGIPVQDYVNENVST